MVNETLNFLAKDKSSETPNIPVLLKNISSTPNPEKAYVIKINYQDLDRHVDLFAKDYMHANIKNHTNIPY